jgi:hypothetical protein
MKESEERKHLLNLWLCEYPNGSLLRRESRLVTDSNIPTVSLGSLINKGFLRSTYSTGVKFFLPLHRAKLCNILARSLLQLSHITWTSVRWHIDEIFFLEDPSTQTLLDKERPYLSWNTGIPKTARPQDTTTTELSEA